jgi:hypothetical protein
MTLMILSLSSGLSPVSATPPDPTGHIRGYVTDQENGERLGYANVLVEGTTYGAAANQDGYFLVQDVPAGDYSLVVRVVGYEVAMMKVSVSADQVTNVEAKLTVAPIEMAGVTKTVARGFFRPDLEVGQHSLRPGEIEIQPPLAEPDLFRSLTMLPGVLTHSDFRSQLIVRGGSPDQNLILVDDLPVFNPTHLGGVFSSFNVDAIREAELNAGGYPAEFGGNLSSVLNVHNRAGNSKKIEGQASLSRMSAGGYLEGPIPTGSWIVSYRQMFLNESFQVTGLKEPDYSFYDLQAKVTSQITDNNRLILTALYGQDALNYWDYVNYSQLVGFEPAVVSRVGWDWGNGMFGLKWQFTISPKLLSDFLIGHSLFRYETETYTVPSRLLTENGLTDDIIKWQLSYLATANHTFKLGVQQERFNFFYNQDLVDTQGIERSWNPVLFSGFIQDQWTPGEKLNLRYGIRLASYNLGDRITYDPRISLRYRFREDATLKAAFGTYHQFYHSALVEDRYLSVVDLWMPVLASQDPQEARHYLVGVESWLTPGLTLGLELYYKSMDHLLDFNEVSDPNTEEDDFTEESGYARGVEILLKRSTGQVYGWLSYTFSQSIRKRGNLEYAPRYNRAHTLNLSASTVLYEKYDLTGQFFLGTGQPFSKMIGRYRHYPSYPSYSGDKPINIPYQWRYREGDKNTSTYPLYHRLDLNLSRTFNAGFFKLVPYFGAINIFNHRNILHYYWVREAGIETVNNPTDAKMRIIIMYPRFLTAGIRIKF